MSGPRTLRVAMSDGRVLHARAWGPETGSPVCIMLHGLGDSSWVWNKAADSLHARFRVLAPDLPGHGDSSWRQDGSYAVEEVANDLLQFAERLDARRAVLVGHSWGGQLAIELAASSAMEPSALVLVDSGPELDSAALAFSAQAYEAAHCLYASVAEFQDVLASVRPWASPSLLADFAAQLLQRSGAGWRLRSDPCVCQGIDVGHPQVIERLWNLAARQVWPTRVLRGASSGFIRPTLAERIARSVPHCDVTTLEGGHALMLDNSSAFAEALLDFLRDLPEATGTADDVSCPDADPLPIVPRRPCHEEAR